MGHGLAETFGAGVSSGVEAGLKQVQQDKRDKRLEALKERKAKQKRNMDMAKELGFSITYQEPETIDGKKLAFTDPINVKRRFELIMTALVSANGGETIGPAAKHLANFWANQSLQLAESLRKTFIDMGLEGEFNPVTLVNLAGKNQPPGAFTAYMKQVIDKHKKKLQKDRLLKLRKQAAKLAPKVGPGTRPREEQITIGALELAQKAGDLGSEEILRGRAAATQSLRLGQAGEVRAGVSAKRAVVVEADRVKTLALKRASDIIKKSRDAINQANKIEDRFLQAGLRERNELRTQREEARTILKENEARLKAAIAERRFKAADSARLRKEDREIARDEAAELEAELKEVNRILNRQAAATTETRLATAAAEKAWRDSPEGMEEMERAKAKTRRAIAENEPVSTADKIFLGLDRKQPWTQGQLDAEGWTADIPPEEKRRLQGKEGAFRAALSIGKTLISLVQRKPQNLGLPGFLARQFGKLSATIDGMMRLIPGLEVIEPKGMRAKLNESPFLQNMGSTKTESAKIRSLVVDLIFKVGALQGQVGRGFSDRDYINVAKQIGEASVDPEIFTSVLRSFLAMQNEAFQVDFKTIVGKRKFIGLPDMDPAALKTMSIKELQGIIRPMVSQEMAEDIIKEIHNRLGGSF
jgi:hypothetical protein